MTSSSSSDEGEIVENRGGNSKATSLPQIDGHGVDRMDRSRARFSRSRSPEYLNGPRHRPAASRRSRSPRGLKRSHDDRDSYRGGRLDPDPRRFRVHYEDSRDSYRRTRISYDDEDRPPSRSSTTNLHYDDRDRNHGRDRARDRSQDRDRYSDKRPRNRTRSPYNSSCGERDGGDAFRRENDRARRDTDRNGTDSMRSSRRQNSPRPVRGSPDTFKQRSTVKTTDAASRDSGNTPTGRSAKVIEPEKAFESENPIDIDAELERRRRRRQELLTKARATPMLVQALQSSEKANGSSPTPTRGSTPMATEANTPLSTFSSPRSPSLQEGLSLAPLDIANDQELINTHGNPRDGDDEDGPSAADYDPTADMREDELRDERRHGHVGPHGEILYSDQKAEMPPVHEERTPKKPATEDDDDFDMFAEDFDEDKFVAPKAIRIDTTVDDRKDPAALAQPNGGGILEGDDKDGYYKIRNGEIMNGRYQVQSTLGKGMFSGVARAVDITNKRLVAIKMMRNNDALRKGGFTEIAILQKLNDADPENRKHIVKFERHFEHKGHLCLAFENLSLNLREVLRKFGNNIGINLSATRAYAHQIFVALAHLRKCSIVHADLKPDNILVNETRNILKICDLGTAIDRSDAATAHTEITPYLVSRFYRAPEIILGMPYDYAVDMWSIGCTLYELYTGKILFAGDSNNQMLKAIMEIRGKFSAKLYKRGELSHLHFDEAGNFISAERDKALGKTTIRTLTIVKPTRDLRTRLMAASGGMNDTESRDLNNFVDLLERCLALNPDKRITPSEALKHPFFLSKVTGLLR
ncbi:putative CMGC DYRK PRP4 protein kinase [Rosellinia necatrix]|uniref:non-specific serine/threonine protein kinase n=1 Tax=Rosellinia necatrix TaxID=77044 RepID=A0A1W2TDE5_ROSNE|nr:putative CMGC DYRK PRP4 protein kinase [Rosellinia necatrix]